MNLEYEFRVLGVLNYAFIYLLAVIKMVEWGGKSFSQSTDMMQTSYSRLMYMTLLTLKLRLREKSHFRS